MQSFVDGQPGTTPANVKLLLPPRQSRGASLVGLADQPALSRPSSHSHGDGQPFRAYLQTRSYLAGTPNRFEFMFTPTHGSWLNLIESFFGKMAKTLLRGVRVNSKAEFQARIELYLKEVNDDPVIFKWKYKLEELNKEASIAST